MPSTARYTALALGLAMASILATRLFQAFTLAEGLAAAACAAALALWLAQRRGGGALDWPRGLIVAGGVIGLTGLLVKLVFVVLGIGVGEHDMASHEAGMGSRLLEHIHHLFFNLGFLAMAAGAVGLAARRFRPQRAKQYVFFFAASGFVLCIAR